MICVPGRHRKEALVPKRTDGGVIEVLSVVGDITNVMTIDSDAFLTEDEGETYICGSPMMMSSGSSSSSSSNGSSSGVRPRKRAKLDHLSPEEKSQHRKMMNRISAQSARDRQKSLMQLQEIQIKKLNASNEALQKQNEDLQSKCTTQAGEISRLSSLVKEYEAKIKVLESFEVKMDVVGSSSSQKESLLSTSPPEASEGMMSGVNSSLEPAVPRTVPLPKGPELLKHLSYFLALVTCFQWILTHPNSSKLSTILQNKFSILESNLKGDLKKPSSIQVIQKLMRELELFRGLGKSREPG